MKGFWNPTQQHQFINHAGLKHKKWALQLQVPISDSWIIVWPHLSGTSYLEVVEIMLTLCTTGRLPLQFWSMIRPLQLHDRKSGSCFVIQQRLERKRVAIRTWQLSAGQQNTASNKHVTYQAGKTYHLNFARWRRGSCAGRIPSLLKPIFARIAARKGLGTVSRPGTIECAPCSIPCQYLGQATHKILKCGLQAQKRNTSIWINDSYRYLYARHVSKRMWKWVKC